MDEIRLPRYVFETDLPRYVTLLLRCKSSSVVLDFERIQHFIPGAVVATLAQIKYWLSVGTKVTFRNHETNTACGYLQRIDFFKQVGLCLPEIGTRRDAAGRFVPIEEVGSSIGRADKISSKMAECVAPGGYLGSEVYPLVQYAAGEIITNCKQHATGSGFVSAQVVEQKDFARIAIADCGRGIRLSFKENNSPHFHEDMTDTDAILAALKPRISSTTHIAHLYGTSPNKGVGLSVVRQLVQESDGYMSLISGDCSWTLHGENEPKVAKLGNGGYFHGTICAVTFNRGQIANYSDMLQRAKASLGLTSDSPTHNLFI